MDKKDRLEIILEDMNSKFDLVLEGHQVTQRQLEEYKKDTDQKLTDLSSLLIASNKSLRKDLRETETRLNEKSDCVENKVDRIETKLDEHMRQPAHV